jgi:hypothetical protein
MALASIQDCVLLRIRAVVYNPVTYDLSQNQFGRFDFVSIRNEQSEFADRYLTDRKVNGF